jgi:uncharacterized protein
MMGGQEITNRGPENTVQMIVGGITLDPSNNMPIIILKSLDERMAIPIWIGLIEASAIATEIEGIKLARPMTHDLLKNILLELGGRLLHIVINDLRDNTFFAVLVIDRSGQILEIDSRPSDAIALAIRCKADIFVAQKVIDSSQQVDPDVLKEALQATKPAPAAQSPEGGTGEAPPEGESTPKAPGEAQEKDKWTQILESLRPEDFGKYKM